MPEHAPYCTANFCLHWVESTSDAPDLTDTDGDGAPDYVETMAAEFEFVAHAREQRPRLARRRCPTARAAATAGSTSTSSTSPAPTSSATPRPTRARRTRTRSSRYMVMDEDYSDQADPAEVLQVTAAHEYNHILQFAYDAAQDTWMFESTAVWMEDLVYDDGRPLPRLHPELGDARRDPARAQRSATSTTGPASGTCGSTRGTGRR